jgi:hypothetical protein
MMKKIAAVAVLVLMAVLFLAWPSHSTTSALTGLFKDGSGNPINGTLTLQLPVPAVDTATNTAVAPTVLTYRVINGVLQAGPPVFDVAGLQPQNLYYQARLRDTAGALVFTGNYAITGTPYNISAAIPTNVTTSNISFVNPAVTNAPNTFCCTQTFLGQIVSTLVTGTSPFSIASTTLVPNLNVNLLNGIAVSGTPSTNQVLTATSTSAANWQTPSTNVLATYTNDTVTGTATGLLAKLNAGTPSKVITAAITDTGGVIGVCVSTCSTSGSASISTIGTAGCIFDGATTAGDYVQISSTTAGDCHDAGATYPSAGQILGRVLSTNGGGGTFNIALFGIEIKGSSVPIIQAATQGGVCSTAAAAGSSCTTVVNWPVNFADTAYRVTCSGITPTQFPFYTGITNKAVGSVTIQLTNGTNNEAQVSTFATIECIGVHP